MLTRVIVAAKASGGLEAGGRDIELYNLQIYRTIYTIYLM